MAKGRKPMQTEINTKEISSKIFGKDLASATLEMGIDMKENGEGTYAMGKESESLRTGRSMRADGKMER